MRPMRVLFAAFILSMLAAAVPTSAGTVVRVGEVVLEAPDDGGTVITVEVNFVWHPMMSVEYNLKLFSADKTQVFKIDVDPNTCGVYCGYAFDPADHGWTWREGTTYRWQVKSRDGIGDVNAKSVKRSFTTEMLAPIDLVSPEDNSIMAVVAGVPFSRSFEWGQGEYDEFRLIVKKNNGNVSYDSEWQSAAKVCVSAACSMLVDFSPVNAGKTKTYTWRVKGKIDTVKGKGKSPKFTVRFGTP